jgi:NitT/TauT family transport system substrate-binding protein
MSIHSRLGKGLAAGLIAAGLALTAGVAAAQDKVRVALGDVVSDENLAFLIALERAKERGLDYELTSFAEEELAVQAIIAGQSDIGIGTPYAVIQKTKVPLRIVFQFSTLVFYPVVSNEYQTWKDLDGQPFTFHGRGSGTEAIGEVIAQREGISFGERSYVPGSGNRVVALLNGTIKATILDLANKNKIMAEAGDRFHVLPTPDEHATDEAVFASEDWLTNHSDQANLLVEEMLKLWREMNADPSIIAKEREARGLIADQPAEVIDGLTAYYTEATQEGVYPAEGGSEVAAKADFEFYTIAGQLEGSPDELMVEDFWNLGPLEAARKALGG